MHGIGRAHTRWDSVENDEAGYDAKARSILAEHLVTSHRRERLQRGRPWPRISSSGRPECTWVVEHGDGVSGRCGRRRRRRKQKRRRWAYEEAGEACMVGRGTGRGRCQHGVTVLQVASCGRLLRRRARSQASTPRCSTTSFSPPRSLSVRLTGLLAQVNDAGILSPCDAGKISVRRVRKRLTRQFECTEDDFEAHRCREPMYRQ